MASGTASVIESIFDLQIEDISVKPASARGHSVVAVARDPTRLRCGAVPELEFAQGDVMNPGSVTAALEDVDAVVSALGIRKGDPAGTLTAGARALATAHPPRMVWLGALGAGASTGKAGVVYGLMMRVLPARSSVISARPMTSR